jgi:hypothetical protein
LISTLSSLDSDGATERAESAGANRFSARARRSALSFFGMGVADAAAAMQHDATTARSRAGRFGWRCGMSLVPVFEVG